MLRRRGLMLWVKGFKLFSKLRPAARHTFQTGQERSTRAGADRGFFPIPQAYLGIAFTWSVPMAFVAHTGVKRFDIAVLPRPSFISFIREPSFCSSNYRLRRLDPPVAK